MTVAVKLDPAGTTVLAATTNPGPYPPGWLDVTAVTPTPDVGWTTPDGGQTWQPPAPSSPVGNVHAATQQVSVDGVALGRYIAVCESWAPTLAALTPGQAVDAATIGVLQQMQQAWVMICTALQRLAVAQGYVPADQPLIVTAAASVDEDGQTVAAGGAAQ